MAAAAPVNNGRMAYSEEVFDFEEEKELKVQNTALPCIVPQSEIIDSKLKDFKSKIEELKGYDREHLDICDKEADTKLEQMFYKNLYDIGKIAQENPEEFKIYQTSLKEAAEAKPAFSRFRPKSTTPVPATSSRAPTPGPERRALTPFPEFKRALTPSLKSPLEIKGALAQIDIKNSKESSVELEKNLSQFSNQQAIKLSDETIKKVIAAFSEKKSDIVQ